MCLACARPSGITGSPCRTTRPCWTSRSASRLCKNTLGKYRLDHDGGPHDDQVITLAFGARHLLDADASAESWIRWAREKAIAAGTVIIDGTVAAVPMPELRAAIAVRQSGPEPAQEPELVGGAMTRRPSASEPMTSDSGRVSSG